MERVDDSLRVVKPPPQFCDLKDEVGHLAREAPDFAIACRERLVAKGERLLSSLQCLISIRQGLIPFGNSLVTRGHNLISRHERLIPRDELGMQSIQLLIFSREDPLEPRPLRMQKAAGLVERLLPVTNLSLERRRLSAVILKVERKRRDPRIAICERLLKAQKLRIPVHHGLLKFGLPQSEFGPSRPLGEVQFPDEISRQAIGSKILAAEPVECLLVGRARVQGHGFDERIRFGRQRQHRNRRCSLLRENPVVLVLPRKELLEARTSLVWRSGPMHAQVTPDSRENARGVGHHFLIRKEGSPISTASVLGPQEMLKPEHLRLLGRKAVTPQKRSRHLRRVS